MHHQTGPRRRGLRFAAVGAAALLATLWAGAPAGAVAADETISFEEAPATNNDTPISDEFADKGVSFVGDDGSLYDGVSQGDPGDFDLEGTNGSQFVLFDDDLTTSGGLDEEVQRLSIDVARAKGSTAGSSATLEAFLDGELVDTATVTFGAVNEWQTLTVEGRIDSFTITGTSLFGADNLVIGPAAAAPQQPGEDPDRPEYTEGYRLVAADGGIFTFGDRRFHGSTGDLDLAAPILGGATDVSDYDGYWLVAADGGVFAFNAPFFGSLAEEDLDVPAVEIEPTPSGQGYWIVLADGSVFEFGDAEHFGDMAGEDLNEPIIGMSVTATGLGYWLVGEDGGIFSFGDADFHGSTGNMRLSAPIIDLAPAVDNNGYYLVGADGGVFAFGSAEFKGSTGDIKLNSPVLAMLVAPNGAGYWLGAADGGVFTFGTVNFLGSMGGTRLNAPVLDMVH